MKCPECGSETQYYIKYPPTDIRLNRAWCMDCNHTWFEREIDGVREMWDVNLELQSSKETTK